MSAFYRGKSASWVSECPRTTIVAYYSEMINDNDNDNDNDSDKW